jgi:hypothetical protein
MCFGFSYFTGTTFGCVSVFHILQAQRLMSVMTELHDGKRLEGIGTFLARQNLKAVTVDF